MPALSCDDLAAQLATADTPLLLLDTCTILDVVRAPVRNQLGVHDIQAVHKDKGNLYPDVCIPDAVDLLSLGLPQRGRGLSEQIIQTSFILADHPDEVMKAYTRVRLTKPPSTKAKQSMKDCIIAESYLRPFRHLTPGVICPQRGIRDFEHQRLPAGPFKPAS